MTESVPLGYTLFAVLAGPRPRTAPGDAALAELESVVAGLAADGVTLRGFYDVTGMRAEADLMIWLHTTPGAVDDPAALQRALRALRPKRIGRAHSSLSRSKLVMWTEAWDRATPPADSPAWTIELRSRGAKPQSRSAATTPAAPKNSSDTRSTRSRRAYWAKLCRNVLSDLSGPANRKSLIIAVPFRRRHTT